MSNYTFIVSDETINSYGFSVLTEGIDTAHFEKNPVMLYMHERQNGVVGRWENVRKDGGKLFADAVFDDSTELARQVKSQVEKGFLRSASIGIDNVEKATLNGVDTVVKCRLVEISIVDIPSNANAVKLYRKKGGFVYDLASYNEENTDLKTALIRFLGLSENASDKEILAAVENAVNHTENNEEKSVNDAVKNGYIDANQKAAFLTMAKAAPAAFADYIRQKRQSEQSEITAAIENAANEMKILFYDRPIYQEISGKIGVVALKRLLSTLKPYTSLYGTIKDAKKKKSDWTLDDYRKYDPEALKDNPELYKELLEKATGEPPVRSLDWYRKNDPETLRNNPELYNKLTTKK